MLFPARELLVLPRTQTINALRGHLVDFVVLCWCVPLREFKRLGFPSGFWLVPIRSLSLSDSIAMPQTRKQRRTQVVRSLIAEHLVGHLIHDVRQTNVSGSIDYD